MVRVRRDGLTQSEQAWDLFGLTQRVRGEERRKALGLMESLNGGSEDFDFSMGWPLEA